MDAESFWSALVGSGLAVASWGFWLKSYFGPYLASKAKNLATHEDIQKLVDQVRETEMVKSQIADSVWDRQARWSAKRDAYERMIGVLTEMTILDKDMWRVLHNTKTLSDESVNKLRDHSDALLLLAASSLFVCPDARNGVKRFMDACTNSLSNMRTVVSRHQTETFDYSEEWQSSIELVWTRLGEFVTVAERDVASSLNPPKPTPRPSVCSDLRNPGS
jgi:hypothetical protein